MFCTCENNVSPCMPHVYEERSTLLCTTKTTVFGDSKHSFCKFALSVHSDGPGPKSSALSHFPTLWLLSETQAQVLHNLFSQR